MSGECIVVSGERLCLESVCVWRGVVSGEEWCLESGRVWRAVVSGEWWCLESGGVLGMVLSNLVISFWKWSFWKVMVSGKWRYLEGRIVSGYQRCLESGVRVVCWLGMSLNGG